MFLFSIIIFRILSFPQLHSDVNIEHVSCIFANHYYILPEGWDDMFLPFPLLCAFSTINHQSLNQSIPEEMTGPPVSPFGTQDGCILRFSWTWGVSTSSVLQQICGRSQGTQHSRKHYISEGSSLQSTNKDVIPFSISPVLLHQDQLRGSRLRNQE